MAAMGFPDAAVQTTIIQHIADEEKAMTPVRSASRALMDAMHDPNATPERLKTLLDNLHVAIEADKLRRKEAQIILDNKIGYSRSPRLEAMLTLLGVLDDGPSSLSVNTPSLDTSNRTLRPNILMRVAPQPNAAGTATTPAKDQTKGDVVTTDTQKEPVKDKGEASPTPPAQDAPPPATPKDK